ncbi:MAG: phosphodiester glycosidase family protein [Bacteroidia bacterium]
MLVAGLIAFAVNKNAIDDQILSYTVDTKTQNLQLFWKDEKGEILKSFQNLKQYVERKNLTLTFAMNGGMFNKDFSPQGLFIENNQTLAALDTAEGNGNFYIKPNGVFYITIDNTPIVCKTTDFKDNGKVKFATQSGPMLVIDGQIHDAFKSGSANLNIRNGVGILPDNKVVFAMSKTEINFYDFAKYFQNLGCKNALYLDGFVSRTYLPEKSWTQTDGNFGVMIGVTTKKK